MRSPLYELTPGHLYVIDTRDGEHYERTDYKGWINDEGSVLHQFGRGRDRCFVEDRRITSLIDRGEKVTVKHDGRAR